MAVGTRPRAQRNRSNSVPLIEALGCSTPEAELILAEGRAAVRRRHGSKQRRGHRHRSENDEVPTLRPRDHLKYLDGSFQQAVESDESESIESSTNRHSRVLSDASVSTVTGPTAHIGDESQVQGSPSSPLGNYSANLAQFIQSQLASIPSYHPIVYPRSCPDLTTQARSPPPPQSPKKCEHRNPFGSTKVIEMPPVRPPLRSAFSAWSSTDDDTEDELPPLPTADHLRKDSKANNYTPSILRYYEASSDGSFLFSSTPSEEGKQPTHPNADGFSFPGRSTPPATTSESHASLRDDYGYPSSSFSMHPQLISSSAPSFSSTSTTSYFERPISIAPGVRDRIIAAVSPHPSKGKILSATSPFEGGALANVHDILVESQHRVLVDGLSFDLIRDFSMPAHRMPTPC
jgi:hypothetical protein